MTDTPANPAALIAAWSDRLRDISALGLRYAKNFHDREHFAMVQVIAIEMLAAAGGQTLAEIEPLRDTVFARATPMCGADAACFDDAGRLLLHQRADNGLWAMPGGLVEVGESASDAAVREALEETGVSCRVVAPVGVYDGRKWGDNKRQQIYHFVFLCEPVPGAVVVPPSHAIEVLDVGWFAEDALPPLDPGHAARWPHVFAARRGGWSVWVD